MSNKLVALGIKEALGTPISRVIVTGRPLPTFLGLLGGALIGGVWGDSIALRFIIPFALIGAIIGTMVCAICFPRPTEPPRPPGWFGRVIHIWERSVDTNHFQVTLMEHAIYSGDSGYGWQYALENMAEGVEPDAYYWKPIALDRVRYIECVVGRADAVVGYERTGQVARQCLTFDNSDDRAEFFAATQSTINRPFALFDRQMSIGRATLVPCIILGIIIAAACGVAGIREYWIRRPPAIPDSFVNGLTSTDPLVLAAINGIAIFAALGWVVRRYQSPPMMRVLEVTDATSQ